MNKKSQWTSDMNRLPHITTKSGIDVTSFVAELRTWMALSLTAGKPVGKAPSGMVYAKGPGLFENGWGDYGENVLAVLLEIENGYNGHGGVNLRVIVEDGFVHVYHGDTKLGLDFKVDGTPKQGLMAFAAAVAPLLNLKVNANGNGKTAATSSSPKTASGMKVADLKFEVDTDMNLSGSATCEGGLKWTVLDPESAVMASGDGSSASFKFGCQYGIRYVLTFEGADAESARRGFTPDPDWQAKRLAKADAPAATEAPASEQTIEVTAQYDPKKKVITGQAFCKDGEQWAVTLPGDKKPLDKGKTDKADFKFKGEPGTYTIAFKVGDEIKQTTFEVVLAEK